MAQPEAISGRSRNRSPIDKARARKKILEATAALIVEKGYEGFSLREVARRTGFSPGNLYLYFRNKDDLLYAVIEDGFRHFRSVLAQAAADHANPIERIAAMGKCYIRFGLENAALYDLMFVKCPDYLFVERPVPGLDSLTLLQEAIQEGVDAGLLHKEGVESTADAVWAAVHGVVVLIQASPLFEPTRIDRLMAASIDIIVRGIRLP